MDELVSLDNRKALRIPYSGAVRFSADQFHWHLNKAQNISKEGLFIETGEVFTLGTNLYLHIDLAVDTLVVKKIRTVGKVVRLGGDKEDTSQIKSGGLGIHFSLLPSEERIIRDFATHGVNPSLPEDTPAQHNPARHVSVEVHGEAYSCLQWWLQEALNKLLSTNGLILELTVILAIIVVYVIVFLK
jgi:Tfp pilus assembly protein PilZ